MNRGRIQAQGLGLEESEAWAQANVPLKSDGYNMITRLKGKLTEKELRIRQKPFDKVARLVANAPIKGYDIFQQSFSPCPPIKDARVDVEVKAGRAFKND